MRAAIVSVAILLACAGCQVRGRVAADLATNGTLLRISLEIPRATESNPPN